MTKTDFVYNPPPFFQREVKARRGGMDGLGLAPPPGELSRPIPREAVTERAPSPPQCEHWGTSPKGGGKKSAQKGRGTPQIGYTAPLVIPGMERRSARTLPPD